MDEKHFPCQESSFPMDSLYNVQICRHRHYLSVPRRHIFSGQVVHFLLCTDDIPSGRGFFPLHRRYSKYCKWKVVLLGGGGGSSCEPTGGAQTQSPAVIHVHVDGEDKRKCACGKLNG